MCFQIKQKIVKATGIIPYARIDLARMYAIVRAKAEEYGDTDTPIFLPDKVNKVYKKEDVMAAQELEEVSSIKYVAEEMDCDDFAAMLFGKFAGLVWTGVHALNWFVDDKDTFWFIEPQNKKMSQTLEGWQGNTFQFFIGR